MLKNIEKKPVLIITGYLGSGKTTVLNELLLNQEIEGLALIINDMGSINIDASFIKQNSVVESDHKMIELTNGCICCTLQEAFMDQIETLSKDENVQKIVVEASGISNPASIAEGFLAYEETHKDINFYLDSMVTVVDGDRIYQEFFQEMEEKVMEEEEDEDDPDIINLVMDQIEFCNLILLNKCDLLSEKQKEEVKRLIRGFQKKAEIIECTQGKVDGKRIFNGSKFNYEEVLGSSVYQETLTGKKHEEDHDEYGITSFVYEEVKPFDYDKFMEFMEQDYPEEIIRGKGYIWFADDDIHVQLFEQAGRNASVSEVSNWVAAMSQKDQKQIFRDYPDVLEAWDETYGDRLNQIVFIGRNYDKEGLIKKLDACIFREEK